MQCECGNPEMRFLYNQPTRFDCFWCEQCGRLGMQTINILKFGLSVRDKGTCEKPKLLLAGPSLKKRLPPDVVEAIEKEPAKISRGLKSRTTELVRQLKSRLEKKKDDKYEF